MGKMLPIPGATGVPDYLATSLEEISVVLVRVRGEVDLLTAPLLKQVLQEAVGRGKDVGVDLHDTTYLDGTGIRAFEEALDGPGRSAQLVVIGSLPHVEKTLRLCLNDQLRFAPSLVEGLALLADGGVR